MSDRMKRKIILEDGSVYTGEAFGYEKDKLCEVVFNTSMSGYTEIISDPSYTDQGVVMTYPLIGNYGICREDFECVTPSVSALIVREFCERPSNFRCEESLEETMRRFEITGVSGIDTRKLTRHIREKGSMKAWIVPENSDTGMMLEQLRNTPLPIDGVSRVSTKEIYTVGPEGVLEKTGHAAQTDLPKIVAIDCGMKKSIPVNLAQRGCIVTVVPHDCSPEQILELSPAGVFVSNGPGDPENAVSTIRTIKTLIGKLPVCGICLGHQIISLACGAKTYKLKFGHRGGNHPVKNLLTDKIEITSQNHSYAVDAESLAGTGLEITHINILDNTVEGVRNEQDRIMSVQYHPESAPGPVDSGYLFDEFLKVMTEG